MDKDMDQFLEKQNYMIDNSMHNTNLASAGDGLVGGVQAEVVSAVAGEILGGKYDEHHEAHDVTDDDELKYVEEVQQSEKQQQLQALKNFGLNDEDGTYESNELAQKETSNSSINEFGNGNGGFVFGGDHHIYQEKPKHDLFKLGNGHETNGHNDIKLNEDFENLVSKGFEEKLSMMENELDDFKNDGGLTSNSQITETVEGFVPQIDVKIESTVELQEMIDEEEPSSLATNTTNGTSSLSENIPPQSTVAPQANAFDTFMANLKDKENLDPLTPQRPNELDLEQAHSLLNPDAKEFVPSFGSNPVSPTSPIETDRQQNEQILSDIMETQMYFGQAPNAVPQHVLDDDDFVAHSPRKGKGENNMDSICLPRELSEFEQEADKRPHELEARNIDGFHQIDGVMTPDQALQQLPLDDQIISDEENGQPDSTDYQPSNILDHGPETSVDLCVDTDVQSSTLLCSQNGDDVMKTSIYVASDGEIEDVLNSVQPIPTEIDSINNSFLEESVAESETIQNDKEILQTIEDVLNGAQQNTSEIDEVKKTLIEESAVQYGDKEILQTDEVVLNREEQSIPPELDNVNDLFIEKSVTESAAIQIAGEKELLQVEEKEHVSNSASTEEIQMDLQNALNSSNKDISQLPIDMDNTNAMHESMYMKQEEPIHLNENQDQEIELEEQEDDFQKQYQSQQIAEHEIQEKEIFHKEIQYDNMQYKEEVHNLLEERDYVQQQLVVEDEPQSLENFSEKHYDLHDDMSQIQVPVDNTLTSDVVKENVLDNATTPLVSTESFLDISLENHELQQGINEAFSPFKISDEVSNIPAIDPLDDPVYYQEHNEESNVDVIEPFTADEKHLIEETKEQQLFSVSGLEQQMSEMILNESDDHFSQAEHVATTPETAVIEDVLENHITTDKDITHEGQHQQHEEQIQDRSENSIFVDDSFHQHEQECLQYEQEMDVEFNKQSEPKTDLNHEPIESLIEQHQQQELERELFVVEEPVIEAKEAAPLIINEETEIVNVSKTEEMQKLPTSMVHETTPAELLELYMTIQNETEIVKGEEKEAKPQTAEEIKIETIGAIEIEELKTKEEDALITALEVEEFNAKEEDAPTAPEIETIKAKEEDDLREPAVEELKAKEDEVLRAPEVEALKAKEEDSLRAPEIEEFKSKQEDESIKEEITPNIPVEAAIVVAAAAAVTTAAAVTKVASSPAKTKTETAKKPLSKTMISTTKPKVSPPSAAKKPGELAKKPATLADKPRTVPAKPAVTSTDKKPLGKTIAARKPLSTTAAPSSKPLTKTSTLTSTTRTAPAAAKATTSSKPTTAPRTVSSTTTTARKPIAATVPLPKPRPASAPAKPTTLGLSATNGAPKTKPVSPRATLTSQVRKTTTGATGVTKSPGVAKTASSTLASRTKPSTVSNTVGPTSKTFTARPAPKFTSSSSTTTTTTTTRRLTVGTTTSSSTTSPLRKTSPIKSATGRTASKSTTPAGGLKSKSPLTKPASSPSKPAPIRKPVANSIAIPNGEDIATKQLNGTPENINDPAKEQQQQVSPKSADLQAVLPQQQNCDSSIPMQSRDQQMSLDLINA